MPAYSICSNHLGQEYVSHDYQHRSGTIEDHEEDWQKLLDRADQALYKAKNNGRDQWAILDA
jgi:GGDEF domain-containing protein